MSIEKKKRDALKISIKEGAAANVAAGFGDNYMTPAVLALQGTAGHVGILNALTGILGPAAQLWGNKLEKKYKNKKIVSFGTTLQILTWILISLTIFTTVYFSPKIVVYFLMILFSVMVVLGGIIHPAFFSWMGNLVRKNERGKYFGRRSSIIGFVGLISTILSALLLDIFENKGLIIYGLILIFLIAAIFRSISLFYLKRQYDPDKNKPKIIELPWKSFISLKTRIGRFTVGITAFNFALMIASPFFAVYLLQERGYSYLIYTVVIMGNVAWSLIFLPLVGKFSDKYGNAALLNIAGVLFSIAPPLWIIIENPLLLILIPQMFSGLANAAFNIGFANYIYANMPKETQGTAIAHINLLGGIGVVIGSLIGGYMLTSLSHIPNIFLMLFLLAAILRGGVSLLFLSKLRDVKSNYGNTFNLDIMHPLRTIYHDTRIIKHLIEK